MFSSYGTVLHLGPQIYFEEIEQPLFRFERNLGLTVLIYGSVARDGHGNDLDMIIVGTEDMWQKFKAGVLQKTQNSREAVVRYDVAQEMFWRAFQDFEEDCDFLVDIYIFPLDWIRRLQELQNAFPHEDPYFMRNIAADAKTLKELYELAFQVT